MNSYSPHTRQQQLNYRRWEKVEEFKTFAKRFSGGQLVFLQHARGRDSLTFIGEIEEIRVEGDDCIIRLKDVQFRSRDRLGDRWTLAYTMAEITVNIIYAGRIEDNGRSVGFTYSEATWGYGQCTLRPKDLPYEFGPRPS